MFRQNVLQVCCINFEVVFLTCSLLTWGNEVMMMLLQCQLLYYYCHI